MLAVLLTCRFIFVIHWALLMVFRYLEKVHPCFPFVDERLLLVVKGSQAEDAPAPMLCEIYAVILTFWDQAGLAGRRPCPNQRFAWNLATAALQEDFMAPCISTLQTVLLDLTGRPIFSLTGNGINNGRSVGLAHSLGLNRDPSKWNISEEEKNVRIRLWWGVLVHDTWLES
jgi:hypothetical protein